MRYSDILHVMEILLNCGKYLFSHAMCSGKGREQYKHDMKSKTLEVWVWVESASLVMANISRG